MVAIVYPGGVVCSSVSILIDSSKRFRRLFSARVTILCFGAACIDNIVADVLDL